MHLWESGVRGIGNVVVRLGQLEDRASALAVYLTSNNARRGGNPTPPEHVERVRKSLDNPDAVFLVAEDAGNCVGMALAMQSRANGGLGEPIPGLLYISMIFVAPDRWEEGIGSRLVATLLTEATRRGFERAHLWTHADNERSQRIYIRHGFHRTTHEQDDDQGDRIVQFERACTPPVPIDSSL
jgi:ribosomal protein S18 acetylase RimI-like enzyme